MDAILSVRACLDVASVRLLDRCAEALEAAGTLELLCEQIELIAEHGLEERKTDASDGDPIVVYRFAPMAEVLLREYLSIAMETSTVVEKRTAMTRAAQLAGYA